MSAPEGFAAYPFGQDAPGNSSSTCVFTMWWEEIVA